MTSRSTTNYTVKNEIQVVELAIGGHGLGGVEERADRRGRFLPGGEWAALMCKCSIIIEAMNSRLKKDPDD